MEKYGNGTYISIRFTLYVLFPVKIFQIKSFHKFSIKLIRKIFAFIVSADDLHCFLPFVIRSFRMAFNYFHFLCHLN